MECPDPVVMRPRWCVGKIWDARLQQLLSDSLRHHRPALKPVDTEGLPLAFISFGSHPWHVVHAFLFIMSCISESASQGKYANSSSCSKKPFSCDRNL